MATGMAKGMEVRELEEAGADVGACRVAEVGENPARVVAVS